MEENVFCAVTTGKDHFILSQQPPRKAGGLEFRPQAGKKKRGEAFNDAVVGGGAWHPLQNNPSILKGKGQLYNQAA